MGRWSEDRGKSGGKDGGRRLDGIGIRSEGIGGLGKGRLGRIGDKEGVGVYLLDFSFLVPLFAHLSSVSSFF